MKKILLFCCCLILVQYAGAQITLWDELSQEASADTLNMDSASQNDNSLYMPESLDVNVDSLLNSWHVKYYTKRSENCGQGRNVFTTDSAFQARLDNLPRVMRMPYNPQVRNCIDLYVERRRTLVEYMLGLADFYFPMIEKALDENNLPIELKYLTVVESALNPTALSRAGASGLWQFILPTGKIYGLEINSLIDERRDPVKSTYAACRYFKDMYEIYQDWDLVIAAYNCGPGNVNKAIRRSGGKTDFWEIYQYLPKETRSYVPLFIAANYVMNYYEEHNICPVQTDLPLSTDTIMICRQLHFDQVSELLNVDKELLKGLNPQYKRDIIPGNYKSCPLTLPAANAYAFAALEDTIYRHRQGDYFETTASSTASISSGSTKEKIIHRVRAGETLGGIANKYGVTSAQVRKWNGMRSNRVGVGRNLTLYVDNGGYAYSQAKKTEKNTSVASNTTNTEQKRSKVATGTTNTAKKTSSGSKYVKYKVKSGDSFYTISQKYPGISAKDLMKINNVNSSKLKVGQIIKVPAV